MRTLSEFEVQARMLVPVGGTHIELLANEDLYAHFWHTQQAIKSWKIVA